MELLVVIGVVAIMGALLTEIFYRSLRGGNKSQLITVIKQNGQSVLENMDKNIRAADHIVCPTTATSDTLVVEDSDVTAKGEVYTRFRFIPEGATNGSIQQDQPVQVAPETLTAFLTRICSSSDPLISPTILTDTNTRVGVSVPLGAQFTRGRLAGFKDLVTINFSLKPGVAAPKALADQIDPVVFTTTIELR